MIAKPHDYPRERWIINRSRVSYCRRLHRLKACRPWDSETAKTPLKADGFRALWKICLGAAGRRGHWMQGIPTGVRLSEGNRGREVEPPADGARIEQVLDNLLSNAVKFSPRGGVVHVGLQPDAMARAIRVTVSDSGPGIAPEDLPHLYDRFYQGRRQVGSGLAGSGLGLALAKKVVEAHGGRIWVESERGKGTTVCLHLPFPLKR